MTKAIDNLILNSPYEQQDRYYEIGPQGPTDEMKVGRSPREWLIPIAVTKKGIFVFVSLGSSHRYHESRMRDYGDEVMKVFDIA
jgi:hypothetical protein